MNIEKLIKEAVKEELLSKGVEKSFDNNVIKEGYAVQTKKFNLKTELLSEKNKAAHNELLENYASTLNKVAAELEGVDKESANLNHSYFRSLKLDESYNSNAVFLHSMFFENISDVNSTISTDSLPYMRLVRDFGSFEDWQEDFIACAMSARNGWVICGYNIYLDRYVNTIVDLHSQNVMIGVVPCIVLDCWEHSYYRDYLSNRKKYTYGMMKEFNWDIIESRFEKADLMSKVMKKQ